MAPFVEPEVVPAVASVCASSIVADVDQYGPPRPSREGRSARRKPRRRTRRDVQCQARARMAARIAPSCQYSLRPRFDALRFACWPKRGQPQPNASGTPRFPARPSLSGWRFP